MPRLKTGSNPRPRTMHPSENWLDFITIKCLLLCLLPSITGLSSHLLSLWSLSPPDFASFPLLLSSSISAFLLLFHSHCNSSPPPNYLSAPALLLGGHEGSALSRILGPAPKPLLIHSSVFRGGSVIKNPPANARGLGSTPGGKDPLEKERATHSSILAWEIPWTRLPRSLGSQESDVTWRLNNNNPFIRWACPGAQSSGRRGVWQQTSSLLPGQ